MAGTVDRVRVGKSISRLLRHVPGELDRGVDEDGWAFVDDVVKSLTARYPKADIDAGLVLEVASDPSNPRFALADGKIRAKYGHSAVDYVTEQLPPPKHLFHATPVDRVDAIMRSGGLSNMNRKFVHMSATPERARVAARHHRRPMTMLEIDAQGASESGVRFHSPDGIVWLAPEVPVRFLRAVEDGL